MVQKGQPHVGADVQDTAHPAGRAQGDCTRVQKKHTAPDEEGKVKSIDFQVNNMGGKDGGG